MQAKIEHYYNRLIEDLAFWEKAIESASEEDLKKVYETGQWTLGQLYSHLLLTANMYFIMHVERCLEGHKTVDGSKTTLGKFIFWFGKFPPMRLKVPAKLSVEFPQPEKKEHVILGFKALYKRLDEVRNKLLTSFNPKAKRKHPSIGALNAVEWFALMDFHFRHHKRQLKRINKFLR